MLAALLAAGASNIMMELSGALNNLLVQSRAPHFVQMHAGPVDEAAIKNFAAGSGLVDEQQTVEMLTVDGSNVVLGQAQETEAGSVMDMGFVTQNPQFDYLLGLDNRIIQVAEGEVAVPLYYKQWKQLEIGDQVNLSSGDFSKTLTIAGYVRDVQMNPAIVSSKRFVVHPADFTALKAHLGEIESLIEFRLKDLGKLNEFRNSYESSGLPNQGPSIDYSLFKTLNALTDGLVAMVIILVSLLLVLISLLCLRFTILATLEEDYREIGVMKAIGLPEREIRGLYLSKYGLLAGCASVAGFTVSLGLNRLFTANISLYLGAAPGGLLRQLVPLLAAGVIGGMVVFFCRLMLRKFKRISAVEALRTGVAPSAGGRRHGFTLKERGYGNANVFLGIKDIYKRLPQFGLLFSVVVICVFIVIVPLKLLYTLQAPGFISYMGVGPSDIRIDLQQSSDTAGRFEQLLTRLKQDQEVQQFSPLVTSRFKVLGSDGVWENINVETGDFSIFPLSYLEGGAPGNPNELALSDLNAKELRAGIGESLRLVVDGKERELTVSGIYQDITNGGRTAKAWLPYNADAVLWYVVALDVKPGISVEEKVEEYGKLFYPAKITSLNSYLAQTLGQTIAQLKLVTFLAVGISLSILALMTSLFLRMLLAKDASQVTVLRSIGFALKDIRQQYLVRTLLVSGLGMLMGTVISGLLGQSLMELAGSMLGASRIELLTDPLMAYLLLPLLFLLVVAIATWISLRALSQSAITQRLAA
ncbi:ABC transporter permease [Paenibacillus donghaensis]|uniref:ABC transporter permease n=2 Tax=Paenibacillus donghaensis TaxID=414771 RepID=A0A2Z2KR46_9BACL|nr:ABC transporter permease [Paenibacillus donghaensis]